MNASLYLALVALLCVGLAGCAAALQGGAYLAGLLLHEATSGRLSSSSPSQPSQLAQAERERCSDFTSRGIEVTEPQEIAIPTIEGQVRTFEATILRRDFEGVGSARRESVLRAVRTITSAVSLGAVDTLIEHPAGITHRILDDHAREDTHITEDLLRLSVGLEDPTDLWADLEQALAMVARPENRTVGEPEEDLALYF